MNPLLEYAAERDFLDKVASELRIAKQCRDYDLTREAVEDLEVVVQHTDSDVLRRRAQRLIAKAFDPLSDASSGAA